LWGTGQSAQDAELQRFYHPLDEICAWSLSAAYSIRLLRDGKDRYGSKGVTLPENPGQTTWSHCRDRHRASPVETGPRSHKDFVGNLYGIIILENGRYKELL